MTQSRPYLVRERLRSNRPSKVTRVTQAALPCAARQRMIVVFHGLEAHDPPRRARNGIVGLESQDLGRLRLSPLELPQFCVGRGQQGMAPPARRRLGDIVAQEYRSQGTARRDAALCRDLEVALAQLAADLAHIDRSSPCR